jgi:glycine cleavage system regulatory protein
MRGQAALESMIVLSVILAAVVALLPTGQRSNEVSSALSAARVGATKAITELNAQYGSSIGISKLNFDGGNIVIYLTASMGAPTDAVISERVRNEALKYIFNMVNGGFPANVGPVKTQNYTYDVSVEITRLVK